MDHNTNTRLDAFSDGVFAIAVTLLVLEIRVPHVEGAAALNAALLAAWPSYLAYAISFITIGIMWLNHQFLLRLIKPADHIFILLNALLLMLITFLNFPTALIAEYAGTPAARTAAIVYSGTFVIIALGWNVLWRYASYHRRLLRDDVTDARVKEINSSYLFAPPLYGLSFIAAFFSVPVSLLIIAGLALFFALTTRDG